jgi:hypothetical protein
MRLFKFTSNHLNQLEEKELVVHGPVLVFDLHLD